MAGIEIFPGKLGRLVVKFEYSEAAVAAIKQIPGRQWNPEGKFWTVPDTPEARAKLTELFAGPPKNDGAVGHGCAQVRGTATVQAARSRCTG